MPRIKEERMDTSVLPCVRTSGGHLDDHCGSQESKIPKTSGLTQQGDSYALMDHAPPAL